jgi:hypothetical protein
MTDDFQWRFLGRCGAYDGVQGSLGRCWPVNISIPRLSSL